MSAPVRFRDPRQELEQATSWIVRIDRGLHGNEREELSRWLDESDRHRDAFLEIARLWDRMDVLSELAELFPLREEIADNRGAIGWIAMAGLACLAGIAVALFHFQKSNGFVASYATTIGQQQTVDLPDHSRIRLNTNTALQVEFSAKARLVKLIHGEAHFEVAKDPGRAFTVRTAGIDFIAVGTAFNVRADSTHDLRLTVTEGRVHVQDTLQSASRTYRNNPGLTGTSTHISADVDANNGVVIDPTTASVEVIAESQVAAATAWQQGMAVFQSTPLEQVVAEFGRYSTTRIVIADQKLNRIMVSGYFRIGDIDGLSIALKHNFDIDVQRDSDLIILSAKR